MPPSEAIRIEEFVNAFDYDYPLPDSPEAPFRPDIEIVPTPWDDRTEIVRIGIKGCDIEPEEEPDSNIVLLLDVSGSMNSEDKLPLLVKSMKLLVNQLDEDDTISIVVYAGAAGVVLEPTPGNEKTKIKRALDKLSAGGSTAGGEGLSLAYDLAEENFDPDGVNRIILATDGDFNVGMTDTDELEEFISRKRSSGVFLSVLGFGMDNYNDDLMQHLAQSGTGNAAFIDTISEARKVLAEQVASTLFTIAKDVKIQVEFNPELVSEYRLIGYETRMLNREDFNNDAVDAGDIGAGTSVTAIYEITRTDSDAKLIDESRYQTQPEATGSEHEYAFLKLRQKAPGAEESELVTRPITVEDRHDSIEESPQWAQFATAVAGYGQLLRGDPYTAPNWGFDQVIELAQGSKGADEFGYRAEFIGLARLANTAAAQARLEPEGSGGPY